MSDVIGQAYCINLDTQEFKWTRTRDLLANFGIDVIRHKVSKHPSHRGWRGCVESHLNIIKIAKDRKLDTVTIFEDDIELSDRPGKWINIVESAYDKVRDKDWAVLKMGGTYDHHLEATRLSKNLIRVDNGALWTTHAQIINSKYYDTFLNSKLDIPENKVNIDEFICSEVFYKKMFVVDPLIFYQRPGYSTIDDRNVNRGQRSRKMYKKLKREGII